MSHTHCCQHCRTPVDCDGPEERNYDGFPEVICLLFHLSGGSPNPGFLCSSCADAEVERLLADMNSDL